MVLAGPTVLYLLSLALYVAVMGHTPDASRSPVHAIFGSAPNPWLFVIPFLLVGAITNGEELAWRGFVLPHLQARDNALLSSLLLGAIWGLWHLPKFWATGDIVGIAFAIGHNIAVAVLYTWVYNSTAGSLLLVTLLHAAYNTAYVFLPVNPVAAGSPFILLAVLIVEALAALVIIVVNGPKTLSRHGP